MNDNNKTKLTSLEKDQVLTDEELDELIEEETEQVKVESKGRAYKITRRTDASCKSITPSAFIAVISVVILVFTVIMALSVLVINTAISVMECSFLPCL